MSEFVKFFAWSARGVLAWILVIVTLFLAIAYVGVGNATTDASAAQLYIVGGAYALVSWSALAYTLLGTNERLRWLGLIVPLLPVVLVLAVEVVAGG